MLFCSALLPAQGEEPATQPASQPSATVDSIRLSFDQLSDADPEIRERASGQLMELTRDQLPALRKIMQDALPLSPAQTEALPEIVSQIFLSGEPYTAEQNSGFLGVQADPELVEIGTGNADPDKPANKGIVVVNRVPGFCAVRALRNGDVILRIADSPVLGFPNFDAFSSTIGKHPAGDTIHLQILRRGQVREVAVTLNPRPTLLNAALNLLDFTQRRQQAFQSYWDANFAPLMKDEVTSIDPAAAGSLRP